MDTYLSGRPLQTALVVTGAVAFILQGYDQALMDGLLTLPTFTRQFPAIDTTTAHKAAQNSTLQGTVVALYEVGAAIGALSCFVLGDWYGRKRTTFVAGIFVLTGVILQSTTYSVSQLAVARTWTGLGVGAFTATVPTWVGESVPAADRGRFVMLQGSTCIFGVAFVSWLEFGLYFVRDNAVSWRFPIALQALFGLFVLCAVPFLPESPRWLVRKDRLEDAAQILARLEGVDTTSDYVRDQVTAIRHAVNVDLVGGVKQNPFARTPGRYLNRSILAIAVNVFSQMSGINIVTFYSNTIFESILGFTGVEARVITGCLQTWQFFGATAAVFFIERFGRRGLLLFGTAAMTVAHSGLAGLQAHIGDNRAAAGCSLIFYFIGLGAFPIGLFLLPFMYASEIAPIPVRAQVTSISVAVNWLLNFMVAEVTPKAFSNIHWKYYLVYVACNAFAFVFVWLFAPETTGRSLEEIDSIFLHSRNAFEPVKVAKTMQMGTNTEAVLKTCEKIEIHAHHSEKL